MKWSSFLEMLGIKLLDNLNVKYSTVDLQVQGRDICEQHKGSKSHGNKWFKTSPMGSNKYKYRIFLAGSEGTFSLRVKEESKM